MTAAMITAICTGAVSIIGAITALITALKTRNTVTAHIAQVHTEGFNYTTGETKT